MATSAGKSEDFWSPSNLGLSPFCVTVAMHVQQEVMGPWP